MLVSLTRLLIKQFDIFTSALTISPREAASAAHSPLASPAGGWGYRVVVNPLIGGHQLVSLITAQLNMFAHETARGCALVVAARVGVALHHLLPVLTPPASSAHACGIVLCYQACFLFA